MYKYNLITMKRTDFYFCLIVVALFAPFVLSPNLYAGYQSFNAEHGMVMSFLKFAVLSTLGELLGLRISTGQYLRKGFGVLPRAVVWGVLGMGINLAFIAPQVCLPRRATWASMTLPPSWQAPSPRAKYCWPLPSPSA